MVRFHETLYSLVYFAYDSIRKLFNEFSYKSGTAIWCVHSTSRLNDSRVRTCTAMQIEPTYGLLVTGSIFVGVKKK